MLSRSSRSLKRRSETLDLQIQSKGKVPLNLRIKDKGKVRLLRKTHQSYKKIKTLRSQRKTRESGVAKERHEKVV